MAGINAVRSNNAVNQSPQSEKNKAKEKSTEQSEPSLLKRKDQNDQVELGTTRLFAKGAEEDEGASSGCGGGKAKQKSKSSGCGGGSSADRASAAKGSGGCGASKSAGGAQSAAAKGGAAADKSAEDPNSMAAMLKNLLEMLLAALTSTSQGETQPQQAQSLLQ